MHTSIVYVQFIIHHLYLHQGGEERREKEKNNQASSHARHVEVAVIESGAGSQRSVPKGDWSC